MLRWLIGVIVLIIVAYYVVHEVLPTLQGSGTAPRPAATTERGGGASSGCVAAASGAYDVVTAELRALGPPPVAAGAWSAAVLDLGRALSSADRACGCPEESCRKAREAVVELRGAVALYDGMTRMDAVGNPATYFEAAAARLDEAQRAADSGR